MIAIQALQKEEILVLQYQATKCPKAFGELYTMFFGSLYDYVRKITKNSDDAFDITQEAFIKASMELDGLKMAITFRFWLFRIAKHMCMKGFRNNARIACDSYEQDNVSQDYSTEEALDKDFELEKMALALTTLTSEEQELLLAKYCDGKSIKEIMDKTDLGSSAIKMKLMRARSKMTQAMAV